MSNACYTCQLMNNVNFSKVCSKENNDVDKETKEYCNGNSEERKNDVSKETETDKSNFDDSNKGEDIDIKSIF